MITSPAAFYQAELQHYNEALKSSKLKLLRIGLIRLAIFFCVIAAIYLFSANTNLIVVSIVAGIILFLVMVSKNTNIKLERDRFKALVALNELELRALNREVSDLPHGKEFSQEEHYYNQDIDLFGAGSVFQYINRTKTSEGKARLAELLNSNDINNVLDKQIAIQELSGQPKWRQHFQTLAALVKSDVKNKTILNWMNDYKATIPKAFKYIPLVFSILTILLFTAYAFSLIAGSIVIMWLFVGFIITGPFFKRISNLYSSATKMTETFSQYSKLLALIENQTFNAPFLKQQQANIATDNKKASAIFKELANELNSLDQRNNFLFAFIANGYFLWDLRYAYRIEAWMIKYQPTADLWFESITNIDAYNSLANYAYNRPDDIYPTLTEPGATIIASTAMGHPLLHPDQRVTNDFKINTEDFFIITGANMAGKSTFLRTVALNIVLSNVGLPVCAKTFTYSPIKLISSMRTSDSLVNDESYFFSELKRLKFIIDEIKEDKYFIILDEILKGTNSKDKEEGSKKFVQKLVSSNSTGIIATHDLSLCELEQTLPQINNHYFDAEIVNDELFFDYRFKDGVCQNMNASFLLRKMEIV